MYLNGMLQVLSSRMLHVCRYTWHLWNVYISHTQFAFCRCGAYTGGMQHESGDHCGPPPSSTSLGSSAARGMHDLPTATTTADNLVYTSFSDTRQGMALLPARLYAGKGDVRLQYHRRRHDVASAFAIMTSTVSTLTGVQLCGSLV